MTFPAPAFQLVSNDKTFIRVDQELSWEKARCFCQLHYTDLADLESVNSANGVMAVSRATNNTEAWIGLFFDARISGLSWSTGSTFTIPVWSTLPNFQEGTCATLYSAMIGPPKLGAASCKAQKPSICYYDSAIEPRISLENSPEQTALPKKAEIHIGEHTFMRFEERMSWPSALKYCRKHYTDLADLQRVTDKAGQVALKPISNETEAWIGLYFNVNSQSLKWSSELGDNIPSWMQKPTLGKGLCIGLRTYSRFDPNIYAVVCSSRQPFICFNGGNHQVRKKHVARPYGFPCLRDGLTKIVRYTFGILKADFTISTLMGPEEMKDQLLGEIQEALKLIVGHEQFRLKWVGFEVNKK
ncbi:putative C-type lectin domain family 20 member A [Ctenodactylus gundi]